jgi:hypothetical protein
MAKIINFTPQEESIKTSVSGSIDTIAGFRVNNPTTPSINPNALYAVNWGGLQKVEDLVLVLASVGFVFNPQHPHFETIKHLLDLNNPIIPPTGPQNQ